MEQIAAVAKAAARQREQAAKARRNARIVVDFGAAPPARWMADGPTFGVGPVRAGALLLGDSAENPLLGVATVSAARRDPFWNGLRLAPGAQQDPGRTGGWNRPGRTFRTPTFTIETGQVFYLVRGAGRVYAVVDSHRLNQGPLHGEMINQFKLDPQSQPRWLTHRLDRYVGHRAHLEFTAVDDAPLEVQMVAQGEQPPLSLPPAMSAALLTELKPGDIKSPETLAQAIGRRLLDVAQRLAAGELSQRPATAADAQVADWLIRNRDLFADEHSADSATFTALANQYAARRDALRRQANFDSATAPGMWDGDAENERLLIRGNIKTPADLVPRRFLEALDPTVDSVAGSGRLELAARITDPRRNPFISRVIVNRVWQHMFGRGIVASVDNFGVLGQPPTHPELLDWLALRFVEEGWSLKRLIRRIALSRTYQMSSQDTSGEAADPDNLLLRHARIRRLEGEALRDAILSVSGGLDTSMYGPSVPIYLTPFMQGRGRPGRSGPLDGQGRRSVYIAVRRNFLSPMMLAFDTPIPFTSVGRRNTSNVPAQALILMNDPFVVQQSDVWAKRTLAHHDWSPRRQLDWLYLQAFSRHANEQEVAEALAFIARQAREFNAGSDKAPNDARVWADLCHVLFNAKEFVFVR